MLKLDGMKWLLLDWMASIRIVDLHTIIDKVFLKFI
jgi:hypothetical protein